MITTAIIAEFNPLHSGHEYIIREARRITNADCIVVVLSGSFTQRGDIAIAPKSVRAAAAIACGADIVFELPFFYATSSAEFFASGAVTLLNSAGGIDYLVFGAENNDISVLSSAADMLLCEPPLFKQVLSSCLAKGMSFPAARAEAFAGCGGSGDVFTPNNTLAIEYIKALKRLRSPIEPVAIKRIGSDYNDRNYQSKSSFISASAFREYVSRPHSNDELNTFSDSVLPAESSALLKSACNVCYPVTNDDFFILLRYSILMNRSTLTSYCDFTPALYNRINNLIDKYGNELFSGSYEDFILKIKTKDMTAARIKRAMLHLMTGYTDASHETAISYLKKGVLPYARILALSGAGQSYINTIKKGCDIKLINSLGKSMPALDENARTLIQTDILSSDIYAAIVKSKFNHTLPDEYRAGVIRTV